jgi:hypothetical protein
MPMATSEPNSSSNQVAMSVVPPLFLKQIIIWGLLYVSYTKIQLLSIFVYQGAVLESISNSKNYDVSKKKKR